jgi:Lrp/AsnC family transcriptional regulator, leucine-responsive regulatory protein
MVNIDGKDKIIIMELHKNARISLTDLAKKTGLSIDSVKKRMDKLHKNKVYRLTCLISHRSCGFNNVVNVMIKLQNITSEKYEKFINFLKNNPYVTEIFSISGEWELSIVFVSKNAVDQDRISKDIRLRFGDIIQAWNESLTTKCYKFEEYNNIDFLNK